MGLCDVCGQEMNTTASCSRAPLIVARRRRQRIAFGDEKLWGPLPRAAGQRCRDCGVGRGGVHHPGCAREECMVCGQQLFCCNCEKVEPKPKARPVSRSTRSRRATRLPARKSGR
jgi:hypothetical protein